MTIAFPKRLQRYLNAMKCARRANCCGRRGRSLRLETMEPRHMLAGQGFLQGIAFVDADNDSTLDVNEQRKNNAEIRLYTDSDDDGLFTGAELTTYQTAFTNAEGYYLFDELEPGLYMLEEIAPSGFVTSGVEIQSQLYPASVESGNRIKVEIVDPTDLTVTMDLNNAPLFEELSFSFEYNSVVTTVSSAFGPLPITIDGPGLDAPTDLIQSYCVNIFENLGGGLNVFPVLPKVDPNDATFPANWGRVAYLFNHYGASAATDSVQGAAMQLAIYELLYDNSADATPFDDGFVKDVVRFPGSPFTSDAEAAAVVAQATLWVNESQGKMEGALYLDASLDGEVDDNESYGRQSVICTGSYNFANKSDEPGKLKGKKYKEVIICECDKYGNVTEEIVTSAQSGVRINLYQDAGVIGVLDGEAVFQFDITDSNGIYSFDNLPAGNYLIEEIVPTGYVAVTATVIDVDLDAGEFISGLNFKNRLVKSSVGNYFFIDNNSNGIQDTGDQGVNGVTVKLLDQGGNVIATTVTDWDGSATPNAGYYLFYNLDAGQYRVEFDVPTGVQFTLKDIGDNSLDSDANSNGMTDQFSLGVNQHRRDVDAGVKPEVCIDTVTYKVKDYFDKCQESKAGVIKGITVEYNDSAEELFVQVTIGSYNGRIADGFTIVLGEGESLDSVKAGSYAVFYFDATGPTPVLNVLGYNGKSDGSSIKDSNGYLSSYDPDRIATSLFNDDWVKELTVAMINGKKVMTFRVDVGAINDHVPLKSYNWQGAEIGKYASFEVDTFDGLTTKYDSEGFLTKWSFCYHGWADACQVKTQKCIIKECVDIDDFFAEWGWEVSDFSGNSNGDPLHDVFWDGSEVACDCDDKCGQDDCWDDWDKDCYSKYTQYCSPHC